jgi:hypothetical protein
MRTRRPPTLLERLLGRKRAKRARRRLGYVAVGAGIAMLKPALSRIIVVSGGIALCVVVAVR